MDLIGLIPTFGGIIYTIGAFILALSVIVAIHEYGHYIVGRWSGIHAEVFSIGFGPVLFSRIDERGTQWQIAALPFGGYVKFLGDANAASDRADEATMSRLSREEQRHTMHGAPLWARAATVAAGPIFNFVLSFLIFAGVLMFRGVATDPITVETVAATPFIEQQLLPGDRIIAIDGVTAPDSDGFSAFIEELPVAATLPYTVERDGAEQIVDAPHPMPPLVLGVAPDSAALAAGLEADDVITAVNGTPVVAFSQLREIVGDSDGQTLALDVWRNGETLQFDMTPKRVDLPIEGGRFETRWLIGVTGGMLFEPASERPGVGQALQYGVDQTFFVIRSSLSGLYHMAAGAISTCNLRGPIGIAETSGAAASQGWLSFIWFIGVLSTAVGLLNLFPIPVLDGGHLVFHAYEAITGSPPSDRALRLLMGVGLALMATLMLFAVSNDLFCP